jgi:hypothetical protein
VYEKSIELNPLETAIDELRQKADDFELILKKRDLTLLELYLQGGIIPQVHKGPLAYAEAFLDPNESPAAGANGIKYSKELRTQFKLVFKRLVDLYQRGIDIYGSLAIQSTSLPSASNNSNSTSAATCSLPISTEQQPQSQPQPQQQQNSNSLLALNSRSVDMYNLLQEKFNEFENSFRNLLLVDGVSIY